MKESSNQKNSARWSFWGQITISAILIIFCGYWLLHGSQVYPEDYIQSAKIPKQLRMLQDQAHVQPDSKDAFTKIYDNNYWDTTGQYPSGLGSVPENNLEYLLLLQHLVDHPEINRIVEIGFGDFNVTGEIRLKKNKTYIGYDVVDSINRLDNKNEFFKIIHSIEDLEFVEGDLLITKDVIMHWPLAKVHYFFEKIVPNFKYSFVVNDHTENETILDINYGQWRPLNIRLYTDLPREEVYARSISFYVKRGYIFPNRPCAKLQP